MTRILAVDHGRARTGLALSDPLGITCRPLEVLHERDPDRLVELVIEIAEREAVEEVVVGIPRPLSGGDNEQSRSAAAFAEALSAGARVPVRLWDERFTTKLARQGRREAGSGRAKGRGEPVDAVAACHLLQNYLDSRSGDRS